MAVFAACCRPDPILALYRFPLTDAARTVSSARRWDMTVDFTIHQEILRMTFACCCQGAGLAMAVFAIYCKSGSDPSWR